MINYISEFLQLNISLLYEEVELGRSSVILYTWIPTQRVADKFNGIHRNSHFQPRPRTWAGRHQLAKVGSKCPGWNPRMILAFCIKVKATINHSQSNIYCFLPIWKGFFSIKNDRLKFHFSCTFMSLLQSVGIKITDWND